MVYTERKKKNLCKRNPSHTQPLKKKVIYLKGKSQVTFASPFHPSPTPNYPMIIARIGEVCSPRPSEKKMVPPTAYKLTDGEKTLNRKPNAVSTAFNVYLPLSSLSSNDNNFEVKNCQKNRDTMRCGEACHAVFQKRNITCICGKDILVRGRKSVIQTQSYGSVQLWFVLNIS